MLQINAKTNTIKVLTRIEISTHDIPVSNLSNTTLQKIKQNAANPRQYCDRLIALSLSIPKCVVIFHPLQEGFPLDNQILVLKSMHLKFLIIDLVLTETYALRSPDCGALVWIGHARAESA